MRIQDLGEFGLIERLTRAPSVNDNVVVGIGDDAAVLKISPGALVTASSDMLVEGVHFLRERIPPQALGHKLLAISLSDMAAMGALPKFALISIALPKEIEVEYLQAVYDGLYTLAERFDVSLVGGDTVSSAQLVLDLTILGEVAPGSFKLRSGAKPGDLIVVTGHLGASAAGLAWELASASQTVLPEAKHRDDAIKAHYWPEPQIALARAWCEQGLLTALDDISDGLASEIHEICAASRVGAVLFADRVPISPSAEEAAALLHQDIWVLCLNGGEDYELLATLPKDQLAAVQGLADNLGVRLSVVGEVRPETEGITFVQDNTVTPLLKTGYDHFAAGR